MKEKTDEKLTSLKLDCVSFFKVKTLKLDCQELVKNSFKWCTEWGNQGCALLFFFLILIGLFETKRRILFTVVYSISGKICIFKFVLRADEIDIR